MRIERDVEQERVIDQFFKEYYDIKEWDRQMHSWLGSFFAAIHVILVFCFYEEIRQGELWQMYMTFFSGVMASYWYMIPFQSFRENQQMHSFYDKLKYLPVNVVSWKLWKAKRVFSFVKKMFFASLVSQIVFLVLTTHSLTVVSILYPVIVSFIVPLIINMLTIWGIK